MKHILFICTGNTCRSPLAEGMLRQLARERGLAIEVRSAGVAAYEGAPASDHTATILREKGIKEPHKASPLTGDLLDWADLVLTMTQSHKRHAIQLFPEAVDKIFTLKEYTLDDPAELEAVAEIERLYADAQMKQALAQPITDDERSRMTELQRKLPSYDIADPFGGSLTTYRKSAEEIERSLHKLIRKLESFS
ncbi:low molecular weight protein arginine phosphatase [Paenibacillus hamazuiensis]|uniref:low molecular weight protein arginine phosphatase n=1 Tax=Paenibacillus hamazuiensis TaxID=2936508 RepID=UPI00200F3948|nr:low molecular weight protein arginine phosphatase [Paenibacillus hamazuiensis]